MNNDNISQVQNNWIKLNLVQNNFAKLTDLWLNVSMRLKIYLTFAFSGIILLFYNIWKIKPVTVDITDTLGLTSHMTLTYWVGYILMIFFSIRLYLDKEVKSDAIYIIYLVVIGLFLFGVSIFTEENARFAWSYYPSGEVKTILENGRIDKISEYTLASYRQWPGNHFISIFTIYFSNIKLDDLIKYMPLFWLFSVIFITYTVGKLFKLQANQSFLMSFLMISSFWTINYYYGPQSIAYILYLLFFASIILLCRMKSYISTILIFAAVVTTHLLTSMALIISFLFSSKYIKTLFKNRIKFIILFLIIFIGWYMYVAHQMFYIGVKDFLEQIAGEDIFGVFRTEKYSSREILANQIIHYSRISYIGIYVILMITATIFYLKGRIKEENKELIKICMFWFIGILTLLIFRYGAEIDDRVYIFSLLPMISIVVMTFDKKILIPLAILLAILHMPSHYGTESSDMVYTSELQGSEFLSSKMSNYNSVNYYYGTLIRYYNPKLTNVGMEGFDKGIYDPSNKSLEKSTYIVHSKQINNYLLYVFGTDKIQVWIEDNDPNLFYNNGYYSIYRANIGTKSIKANI